MALAEHSIGMAIGRLRTIAWPLAILHAAVRTLLSIRVDLVSGLDGNTGCGQDGYLQRCGRTASVNSPRRLIPPSRAGIVRMAAHGFEPFWDLLAEITKFAALLVFGALITPEGLSRLGWS